MCHYAYNYNEENWGLLQDNIYNINSNLYLKCVTMHYYTWRKQRLIWTLKLIIMITNHSLKWSLYFIYYSIIIMNYIYVTCPFIAFHMNRNDNISFIKILYSILNLKKNVIPCSKSIISCEHGWWYICYFNLSYFIKKQQKLSSLFKYILCYI